MSLFVLDNVIPVVINPPLDIAYAASLTPDASQGNYQVCTLGGACTLNPPSNPQDGQMWRIRFIGNSSTSYVVTMAAGLAQYSGASTTITVPANARCDIGLVYELADTTWTVMATGVT